MIKIGDKVKMSNTLKKQLMKNGSEEHVDEFGDCIGIVIGYIDYNNDGENDPDKIYYDEFDVRWMPSNLKYGYAAKYLVKVKNERKI